MKKSTITEVIKAILALDGDKKKLVIIANETAIIAKMLYFAEQHSIEEAMRYYAGTHSDIEYKDFLEERL